MSFCYLFDYDQVGEAFGDEFCEPFCEAMFADVEEDTVASKDDSSHSLVESSVSTYQSGSEGSGNAASLPAFSLPGSNTATSSVEKTKNKIEAQPRQKKHKGTSCAPYDEDSLAWDNSTPFKTSCPREDGSVPSDEGRRDVELAARADRSERRAMSVPSKHNGRLQTHRMSTKAKLVRIHSWSDQSSVGSGRISPIVKRRMRNAFKKLKAAMKEQRSITPILNELSHLEELFLTESDQEEDSREKISRSSDNHADQPNTLSVESPSLNLEGSGEDNDPAPPPPPPPKKTTTNPCLRQTRESVQESLVKSLGKARAEKLNATAQHMMLNIDLAFARNRWRSAAIIQRNVRGFLVRLSVKQKMKYLIQDTAALVIQDAWLAYADRKLYACRFVEATCAPVEQNSSRSFCSRRRKSSYNWLSGPVHGSPMRRVGKVSIYNKKRFQCQQRTVSTLPHIQEETKSILSCDTESVSDYDLELEAHVFSTYGMSRMDGKDARALVSPPCVRRHSELPDDVSLSIPLHDERTSMEGSPSSDTINFAVTRLQDFVRGLLCRRRYLKQRESALCLQRYMRERRNQPMSVTVNSFISTQSSDGTNKSQTVMDSSQSPLDVRTKSVVHPQNDPSGVEQSKIPTGESLPVTKSHYLHRTQLVKAACPNRCTNDGGIASQFIASSEGNVRSFPTSREHRAAIDIQRMNRGMMCRIIYKQITSAVILQAFARQFIARHHFSKVRAAVVKIQKAFRPHEATQLAGNIGMDGPSSIATKHQTSFSDDNDTVTNTETGKKQKRRRKRNKKSKR